MFTHPLSYLPEGCAMKSVTARPVEESGRRALRVELRDRVTFGGHAGVDFIDRPTFVMLPVLFTDGTIEVDLLARLNGKGPELCRAFAGLAYRIQDSGERFEAVYVRAHNGLRADPPPPRDQRAIQYFAFPEWPFTRLREERPDEFESGADLGPDEWTHLRVDVDGTRVRASVNGTEALTVEQTLAEPVRGRVGLFVDIGTEAFFSNLVVDAR